MRVIERERGQVRSSEPDRDPGGFPARIRERLELLVRQRFVGEGEWPRGAESEHPNPLFAVALREVRRGKIQHRADVRFGWGPPTHRAGPTDRDLGRPGGQVGNAPSVRRPGCVTHERSFAEVPPREVTGEGDQERFPE